MFKQHMFKQQEKQFHRFIPFIHNYCQLSLVIISLALIGLFLACGKPANYNLPSESKELAEVAKAEKKDSHETSSTIPQSDVGDMKNIPVPPRVDIKPPIIPSVPKLDFNPSGIPKTPNLDLSGKTIPSAPQLDFSPTKAPSIPEARFDSPQIPATPHLEFEQPTILPIPKLDFDYSKIPTVPKFSLMEGVSLQAGLSPQMTNASHAGAPQNLVAASADADTPTLKLDNKEIRVPQDYGKITQVYTGTSGKTILIIEENHALISVQSNVARIIEQFQAEHQIPLILLEASKEKYPAGRLETPYFQTLKDAELLRKLALALLQGARISAVEYILLTHDVEVYAIDSEEQRQKQHESFKDEAREKELNELRKQAKALKESQDAISKKRFIAEFNQFLKETLRPKLSQVEAQELNEKIRLFNEKRISLDVLYSFVKAKAEEKKETFSSHQQQQFGKVEKLYEIEKEWQAIDAKYTEINAPVQTIMADRDEIFVNNSLQVMEARNASAAILNSGSLHTKGLRKYLEANQISYVVITPNGMKDEPKDIENEWFRINSEGEPTPFEKWSISFLKPNPTITRAGVQAEFELFYEGYKLNALITEGKTDEEIKNAYKDEGRHVTLRDWRRTEDGFLASFQAGNEIYGLILTAKTTQKGAIPPSYIMPNISIDGHQYEIIEGKHLDSLIKILEERPKRYFSRLDEIRASYWIQAANQRKEKGEEENAREVQYRHTGQIVLVNLQAEPPKPPHVEHPDKDGSGTGGQEIFLNSLDAKGEFVSPSQSEAQEFQELLLQTTNPRAEGGLRPSLLKRWEEIYERYVQNLGSPKSYTCPDGKTIQIKPRLILKSNEVNPNFAALENVPALADNFLIHIASPETSATQLLGKIHQIPKLKKENVVFAIRLPFKIEPGSDEWQQWTKRVEHLKRLVGEENVIFDPTIEEFHQLMSTKDKNKEIVVIELTHTDPEQATIPLREGALTPDEIYKAGDLSHIKLLMSGLGTCQLPVLGEGKFVEAFLNKGVGIVNGAKKEIPSDRALERFDELIQILEHEEEYPFPADYIPDIIDQRLGIPAKEGGRINFGKIEHRPDFQES